MKKALFCSLLPLLLLVLPYNYLLADMTIVQHRMLAIFALAVLFWMFEPIPIYATSVLIIAMELMLMSTRGPIWFRETASTAPEFGTLLGYQEILGTFASPIIMLFLGGFFLALASTKYKLDVNLARVMLRPFGSNPRLVMLGMMIITAGFSMFMSNTATTALMLTIVTPVLRLFQSEDPGRAAFVLCVPIAANIGGIGTPIGTPPNAIAMKYLLGENAVSFSEWMSFGVPFMLTLLLLAWLVLLLLLPSQAKQIELIIDSKFLNTTKARIVYVTFGGTILLWLSGDLHGMSSYVVAMIPVATFLTFGVLDKKDLRLVSWDVLWLISGGIALGLGLEKSGLSQVLVDSVPFGEFSPVLIFGIATAMGLLMATFISNTATANLLLPIMAALGATLPALVEIGGLKLLVLLVTISCALGMALPVSTPPNAMAYATGLISSQHLLRVGALVSVMGILLSYLMGFLMLHVGFV
jgi:sodium-dependent dicarboxylate transporter 2/3/5